MINGRETDALEFAKYAMAIATERLMEIGLPLPEKQQRMIIRGAIANALEDWIVDNNILPGLRMQRE